MRANERRHPRGLSDEVGYHDLVEDLRKPGCPACHGANRAVWRYLDSLLWEYVNDPGVRAKLRASRGFCREHALTALAVASHQAAASGVAILYEDFLRHVRDEVIAVGKGPRRGGARGRRAPGMPPATGRCPACKSADFVAANYLKILSEADADSVPGRAVREPGRGLCLPHLAKGLRVARSEEGVRRLVDVYLHGEADLRADLTEFIRKQDYRFRGEGFTDEQASSWARAVYRLVGEPSPRTPPAR